jgi:hypothetical protein
MPPLSPAEDFSITAPVQLTREVFGNVPGWVQIAFYLLAAVAVGFWIFGIARRVRLWRQGRQKGARVEW